MQTGMVKCLECYFNFNTLSCQNYFFPEGMGGVHDICGDSTEEEGYFCVQKMEIPGRRGSYVKFPPWWGMDIFWNYIMQSDPYSSVPLF